MAVDYGDRHTGLAVCDGAEILASPAETLHEKDFNSCVSKTAIAAKRYEVGEIVVGNPINMNGSRGPRSEKCALFAEKLRKKINIPVTLWDERSTTITANRYMSENNRSGKKRKESVDAIAAAVILENYLNYRVNHADKKTENNK